MTMAQDTDTDAVLSVTDMDTPIGVCPVLSRRTGGLVRDMSRMSRMSQVSRHQQDLPCKRSKPPLDAHFT